ncbi:MAG: L-threonylcarbamoyladenylate synthase [candidate division WOR-3 bacterium]
MILLANEENIRKASIVIRSGGVVAFPTETVYGLGADALNKDAVIKIFEIKQRPLFDPLIVHISDFSWIEKLSQEFNQIAKRLAEKFWPGPLTIVFKKSEIVPYITTGGLDTVAIRMPKNEIALKLIRYSQTPIAAPSANKFGYISPTTAKMVYEQLGKYVDIILDGGKTDYGIESTIVYVENNDVYVLRLGAIEIEEIEKIIGKRVKICQNMKSPGQFKFHYSPYTNLIIFNSFDEIKSDLEKYKKVALISVKREFWDFKNKDNVIYDFFSENGDLREVAKNLFEKLYYYDKMKLDAIFVQAVKEEGIGRAIMDRLRKAQARHYPLKF